MIEKPVAHIPYSTLPEAKDWRVGKTYRTKTVLRQVGAHENGAEFEIVDATSLESDDKVRQRYFLSDGGSYRAG